MSWLRDNESVLKVVPTWLRGWKPLTRISARLQLTAIIFDLTNTALGYVVVFLGGGLGAAARHWVNRTTLAVVGPDYPAGTLIVNVTGSIALGMLAAWFAFRGETTTAGA